MLAWLIVMLIITVLVLLAAAGAAVWRWGPEWIAPTEQFTASPGGAVAYIGMATQVRNQGAQIYAGEDFTVSFSDTEFTGLVTSALLSRKQAENPLEKVRATVAPGEIRMDAVLKLPYPEVPARFRGPIGLTLWLQPTVEHGSNVRFQLTRAAIGRIPVPLSTVRWAGEKYAAAVPGYDARDIAFSLPLGDLLGQQMGRPVIIKRMDTNTGTLTMTLAFPAKQ
ncbi:MAG TPA: hypothetical protein VD902_16030 [Symbiobacteriaceae bacterium]|nr:hypothetical protein [Symbiobacteriaceae bacterium]